MPARRPSLVPILLVVAAVLGSASSLLAGTITGKITYDDRVPTLKPIDMNADPACAKKHTTAVFPDSPLSVDGTSLANVFVQVKNAPAGPHTPPSQPVVIDQNGCVYVPHVSGVMVGQKLMFKNSDGILHNVHGLPTVNPQFNRAQPASVKEADFSLNKPEPLFRVKCDVHPWMNAYVAVMTHPYFAVTGKDGSFKIDGLPDGTYEIEARHPYDKFPPQTAKVTIAGGKASQNFSFKIPK